MSRRKRWQNVKGTQSRVREPRERFLAAIASGAAALASPLLPKPAPSQPREVLVLRLDRIGDVLMSLPALHLLREALPSARIRLAVGEWSREVARDAPVDEVLIWSAPWVGRRDEGASSLADLWRVARSRRDSRPDLAIDLQGDVRALWLLSATGARARVGYANTGSASLLTSTVELDENLNFVEQNCRAIETALGRQLPRRPFRWLDDARRSRGREQLAAALKESGLPRTGPIVGLHPGAGRRVKEWPIERWIELGAALVRQKGALLVVSGSEGESDKAAALKRALPAAVLDLAGKLGLASFAEVMSALDAFVSGDTSAMHFACALGVPSVAVFGPSDPGRYFSGGDQGFGAGGRHIVVSAALWCCPCNLIRRPPAECDAAPAPECLTAITTGAVLEATIDALGAPGDGPERLRCA